MTTSDLDRLYQDVLIDHSHQRHGYGLAPGPSAESRAVNRSCGDEVTLRIHVAGGRIDVISWTGEGCAISQASASMLSDLMRGLTPSQCTDRVVAFRAMLHSLGKDRGSTELLGDAVALSGVSVYPPRINCAMLAWTAFEDALDRAIA